MLRERERTCRYLYGKHWAPHDVRVREFSTGNSRVETALGLGVKFEIEPSVPFVWYMRWAGQSPFGLIAYDQFPDATSIRTAWKDLESDVRTFVNSLGKDGVNKLFDYKLPSGAPDTAPFWQMLVHVVNHDSSPA